MSYGHYPLRAGKYVGKIIDQGDKKSKNGKPMLFVVVGDLVYVENGVEEVVVNGATGTINMSLSDKAVSYTADKLKEIGFEGSTDQFSPEDPNPRSVVGKQVNLMMTIDPDYGEQFDILLPKGGKPMDADERKRTAAQFSHLFKFKPVDGENKGPEQPPQSDGGGTSWGN